MKANLILVGVGLSGAACLAHLLRDHPELTGRVVVVEPRRRLGAGLAYGTCDPVHRVNVAAGRMSLFPDQPEHFLTWLERTGAAEPDRDGRSHNGLHPRRALFGRYVDESVRAEIARSSVEVVHERSAALCAVREADGWLVTLENGVHLSAPVLVLAVGHSAPVLPPALADLAADPRLVVDPWRRDALSGIDTQAAVLVAGTGLTGCDVVASLRARGHRGPITMLSRRGLLPRPRTILPVAPFGRFDDPPSPTARGLLRHLRAAVAEAGREQRPWEDVIAALREQAATVWGALDVVERRRLLRHVRPFWDVHRFQCAPQIDQVIAAGLADGWLLIRAAGMVSARADAGGIRVTVQPRGGGTETLHVGAVVNCTGPGHRSVVEAHPLLRVLAAQGALRPDPCRLGIDVDGESRVLDRAGAAWPDLFVAGPLARGRHGELMGLPQVAQQPRAVARAVARLWSAQTTIADERRAANDKPQGAAYGR